MSPDDPTPPFDLEESERRPRRVDLDGEVSLKFKEHPGFFEERSANLSPGGMFIRSTEPQPPGTVFDFELTLEGEPRLIHGIGEVAWAREVDEGFDRPPGMGVRFLSLEPESRALIERLVAERLEETEESPAPPGWLGTPAAAGGPERGAETGNDPAAEPDADDEPPAVPQMPGPSPYAYARSYRGSGVSRETRRRGPLLAVLLALALLVALAAAFFLLFPETAMRLLLGEGGGGDEPGEVVEVVAGDEAEPEPVVPVEPSPEADPGAAEAPPEEAEEAEDEMGFFEPPAEAPAPPPEPAPAPPPPAAPASDEDGRAFTRVLNLIWEPRGDEVLVTVFLDGPIEEWEYTVTRLNDPPRALVVIRGVTRPFPRAEIPVGTELVERLRVGFHPERPRSELHVVVDLADPGADLVRSEAEGQELRLFVGRPPGE